MRDYGKYKEDNIIYHKLPASVNCRMNDFTATIVNTILDYYDELLEQKNCISNLYDDFFKSSSFLRVNYTDTSNIAPSYYKYIAFVVNTDICTSPVYDSPNQINSILDMNDYPYTFFGDSVFTPHSCLPITASMDLPTYSMFYHITLFRYVSVFLLAPRECWHTKDLLGLQSYGFFSYTLVYDTPPSY